MLLTNDPVALPSSAWNSHADKGFIPGTRAVDRYGRVYRYVKAGASALVVGNVIQGAAEVTAHQQLTPTAASALLSTQITATLGAVAAAANLYKHGFAIIDTTPGLGYAYPIVSHDAVLSSGVITVNLSPDTPIQVALTTTSRVSLNQNPYSNVIQAPATTLTGPVVGVAVYPIAAGEFGWVGTRGMFGVLITGTPGPGLSVGVPAGTAGAVLLDSAALAGYKEVGRMCVTGAAGKVQAVMVDLE